MTSRNLYLQRGKPPPGDLSPPLPKNSQCLMSRHSNKKSSKTWRAKHSPSLYSKTTPQRKGNNWLQNQTASILRRANCPTITAPSSPRRPRPPNLKHARALERSRPTKILESRKLCRHQPRRIVKMLRITRRIPPNSFSPGALKSKPRVWLIE